MANQYRYARLIRHTPTSAPEGAQHRHQLNASSMLFADDPADASVSQPSPDPT